MTAQVGAVIDDDIKRAAGDGDGLIEQLHVVLRSVDEMKPLDWSGMMQA